MVAVWGYFSYWFTNFQRSAPLKPHVPKIWNLTRLIIIVPSVNDQFFVWLRGWLHWDPMGKHLLAYIFAFTLPMMTKLSRNNKMENLIKWSFFCSTWLNKMASRGYLSFWLATSQRLTIRARLVRVVEDIKTPLSTSQRSTPLLNLIWLVTSIHSTVFFL